jgi:hypothetical protein
MEPRQVIEVVRAFIVDLAARGFTRHEIMGLVVVELLQHRPASVPVPAAGHEQHRARHATLHNALDELVADFLKHHRDRLPSATTVTELIQWSHTQTVDPTEIDYDEPTTCH